MTSDRPYLYDSFPLVRTTHLYLASVRRLTTYLFSFSIYLIWDWTHSKSTSIHRWQKPKCQHFTIWSIFSSSFQPREWMCIALEKKSLASSARPVENECIQIVRRVQSKCGELCKYSKWSKKVKMCKCEREWTERHQIWKIKVIIPFIKSMSLFIYLIFLLLLAAGSILSLPPIRRKWSDLKLTRTV